MQIYEITEGWDRGQRVKVVRKGLRFWIVSYPNETCKDSCCTYRVYHKHLRKVNEIEELKKRIAELAREQRDIEFKILSKRRPNKKQQKEILEKIVI